MIFDREKLSDVTGSRSTLPFLLAQEIRRQFQLKFEPAPLAEISDKIGIFQVSEKPLGKMEGTIVFPEGKLEGEITLNINQDPNRKRFTWAHELGHFVNPYHHAGSNGGFQCDESDIFRFNTNLMEDEASDFASELLLPEHLLKAFIKSESSHNLDRIVALCEHMKISKSAAIRRFVSSTDQAVAFIYSRNGVMRFPRDKFFPPMRRIKNMDLPENSLAISYDGEANSLSPAREICSSIWLSGKNSDYRLSEQVLKQEDGYQITMLSIKS